MSRRRISTGSSFEAEFGYARAVADGRWCFVAGTTGYDYARMEMPQSAFEQAEAALATIALSLEQAGFSMADVVRARYYVTERRFGAEIAPALRAAFGEAPPAATLVVSGLADPQMKVEIEVTALRREPE